MDVRLALLQAAIKVFAETGWRGATTRRIAQAADVNEVTLFRHFKSKDDLLRAALELFASQALRHSLPADPVDPRAELLVWCRAHHKDLYRLRTLIRRSLGEFYEHPRNCAHGMQASIHIANDLAGYLARVKAKGLAAATFDERSATNMLMGALFTDALGRDTMPERYPYSMREAIERYVDLLIHAIGAHADAGALERRTPGLHNDQTTTTSPVRDHRRAPGRVAPSRRTDVPTHATAGPRTRPGTQQPDPGRPRRRTAR